LDVGEEFAGALASRPRDPAPRTERRRRFRLWARNERDEMRRVARGLGVGVELHYLGTPPDELWRRIEARNSEPPWDSYPIHRTNFDRWQCLFQTPDPAELALFDSPPDAT
jgi:predicted kinase